MMLAKNTLTHTRIYTHMHTHDCIAIWLVVHVSVYGVHVRGTQNPTCHRRAPHSTCVICGYHATHTHNTHVGKHMCWSCKTHVHVWVYRPIQVQCLLLMPFLQAEAKNIHTQGSAW